MSEQWRALAACRAAPPEAPFERGAGLEAEFARNWCRHCPVKADCLEYALQRNDVGVWGGMTPKERAREKKRRGARAAGKNCGTTTGYRQHTYAGTLHCEPCKAAKLRYERDYRARRREAVA